MMRNVITIIILAALTACAGKQIKQEPQVVPQPAPQVLAKSEQKNPAETPSPKTSEAQTANLSEKIVVISPLKDPGNILSKRSVYFDFDKYEIKSEFRPLIEAHAKYLIEHPQSTVTLQGNADDRGSREYNLALGQKRAVAVKKLMNLFGVPDKQMETISFGEEKPKALGHDESSWAENRRTDVAHSSD